MQTFDRKNISATKELAAKLSNIIGNLEFLDENNKEFSLTNYICYLLKAAENCDPKLRAEIENNIVKLGVKAVPHLINSLMTVKGAARGLAAMAIIRIGLPAVEILRTAAENTPDFFWISEYVIDEIMGTQVPIAVYQEEQVKVLAAVN